MRLLSGPVIKKSSCFPKIEWRKIFKYATITLVVLAVLALMMTWGILNFLQYRDFSKFVAEMDESAARGAHYQNRELDDQLGKYEYNLKKIKFLIERGATNLNESLARMCKNVNYRKNSQQGIDLLMKYGATDLDLCIKSTNWLELDFIKFLISRGYRNYNLMLLQLSKSDYYTDKYNQMSYLISQGAYNLNECLINLSYLSSQANEELTTLLVNSGANNLDQVLLKNCKAQHPNQYVIDFLISKGAKPLGWCSKKSS